MSEAAELLHRNYLRDQSTNGCCHSGMSLSGQDRHGSKDVYETISLHCRDAIDFELEELRRKARE